MRKGWLGIGILTVFLAGGLLLSFWMDKTHLPGSQLLQQAAEVTLTGDLEQGIALAKQAEALWENSRKATATVADHSPMEEIDSLFGELEFYQKAQDSTLFAGTCQKLGQLTQSIGESYRLNWWNLL